MSTDWNPHFERKKKRSRPSRRPEQPRRYYAAQVLTLISLVFFWQIDFIPAALTGIANSIGHALISEDREAAERERKRRQIQKMHLILDNTKVLLEMIERRQEAEKEATERPAHKYKVDRVSIHSNIIQGSSDNVLTATPEP